MVEGIAVGCVLAGDGVTAGDRCPASGEGSRLGCCVVTVRGRVCPVAGVWDCACAATDAKTIRVNVTVGLFFIIKLSVSVKGLGPALVLELAHLRFMLAAAGCSGARGHGV
ncbi:MAG TPA: hypothetical protein VF544_20085 [Pyrinomonadaceae bacterium]